MRPSLVALLVCVLGLSACSEKPQTLGSRHDATAFSGVSNPYSAPGWKAGDKNSWEQQLRSRGQYGMNDYSRTTD